MKMKWTIFSNAFLSGMDFVMAILNFVDGKFWLGMMFSALAIGLGWLGWNE